MAGKMSKYPQLSASLLRALATDVDNDMKTIEDACVTAASQNKYSCVVEIKRVGRRNNQESQKMYCENLIRKLQARGLQASHRYKKEYDGDYCPSFEPYYEELQVSWKEETKRVKKKP